MNIYWSEEKNRTIKQQQGRGWVGFEAVEEAVIQGRVLDLRDGDHQVKYPWQKWLVVEIDQYAWIVPCVKHEDGYFLKTMYPSRKATAFYLLS